MPTKIAPLIKAKEEAKEPFVAFEYFPPRTEDGLKKLYDRIQRMKLQSMSLLSAVRKRSSSRSHALLPRVQSPCTWM